MPDPSDDELVQRCLEATQAAAEAFESLYGRHAGPVLAFLRGLHPGDAHAARDALQETFFRFYKALPSFDRERSLRPWLMRIARNVSLDAKKKAQARYERPHESATTGALTGATGPGPAEEATLRETAGILREAVSALPEQNLAVFLLKHDQGLTYAEVAEALACSVRTAKYRMKAALEQIGREAERHGVVA